MSKEQHALHREWRNAYAKGDYEAMGKIDRQIAKLRK